MLERWYLQFRSVVFDKTYSCVVQTEGEDALRGEIEHQAMKLEQFSGIPWICEAVKPFPEKGKEGERDG